MIDYPVVTRAGWNARPPTSRILLDWNRVDKFITHYSGALRTQSVRSIQNYCMDTKDHADIDYNDLVRDGVLFEGRGPYVGGHTLGLNSSSYGVCIIGNDGDATDDDFNTVRIVYDKACAHTGRTLRKLGHRTALPNHTDCPGDEIQAWIDAGMPYRNISTPTLVEEDMIARYDASGAKTEIARYLQGKLKQLEPTALPRFGADGGYGDETAEWVSRLLTGGPGTEVNGEWFANLDKMILDKRLGELTLPPLTEVRFTIPAQEITASVVQS